MDIMTLALPKAAKFDSIEINEVLTTALEIKCFTRNIQSNNSSMDCAL